MSADDDKQEIAELRVLNERLSASLKRCHALLDDARSKLAANSNDPEPEAEVERDEDSRLG